MNRREWLISAASLFLGRATRGQDEVTFSTDVKVVNVLATVMNKKGQIVRDLTQDDFSLSENGRLQKLRYFAKQSDLPLTLGLMVDTSMSQQRVLSAEQSASFRFLDRVLREKVDQVFVMQFDLAVQMRQELTSSRQKLEESLAQVAMPTRQALQAQGTAGGTLLYEAVAAASKDVMKSRQGRKALIVLSDGVDVGSEVPIAAAIEVAQRADTLIYSILFSDATFYGNPLGALFGGGADGRAVLMRMSRETGGGFFEVSKRLSIDQIFDIIQDELRSQYSLGYVSDVPVRISEFRKIQLTTRTKGLVVQARDRYWAQR